jgi:hypothetical protein
VNGKAEPLIIRHERQGEQEGKAKWAPRYPVVN